MEQFEIRCTQEQTRKALELGAPIGIKYGSIAHKPSIEELQFLLQYDNMWYKIPTAEQMIGFLEEKFFNEVHVEQESNNGWEYIIYDRYNTEITESFDEFGSRKEATIAAIDAALEYLADNNLIKG